MDISKFHVYISTMDIEHSRSAGPPVSSDRPEMGNSRRRSEFDASNSSKTCLAASCRVLDPYSNCAIGDWRYPVWLVVEPIPLKNTSSSIGMMTFQIYEQIKTVPKHQPAVGNLYHLVIEHSHGACKL